MSRLTPLLCLLGTIYVGLVPSGVSAQEKPNSLEAGAWALQFRINENFTLESFNGAALSVKHHFSDRTALRGGATFSAANLDAEDAFGDTTFYDRSQDSYSVQFNLELLKYIDPASRWTFFGGLGPSFSIGHSTGHSSQSNALSLQEDRYHSWMVGLTGLWGGEWFATRTLSLHAEYQIAAFYGKAKLEREINDDVTARRDADGWSIQSGGVLFGLSAYF